jgi:ABC-type transport system substrate-binding protein
VVLLAATLCLSLAACGGGGGEGDAGAEPGGDRGATPASGPAAREAAPDRELKVLRVPIPTTGPRSLDPVAGSSTLDNRGVVQAYETLMEYSYLKRPIELEPLLITELPEVLDDGLGYRFTLRDDVFFHDDECFPGGEGRQLVTDDVFYSWKRLADPANGYRNWPLIANLVVGFDAYKDEQAARVAAGEPFDYDADVPGLIRLDDRRFEVRLNKPNRQFLLKITMFQMSIVAREAVEFYGERINSRQVGTGPFRLVEWLPGSRLVWERNPEYREAFYPSEGEPGDRELGRLDAAGQRIPFVDRLEIHCFVESNPQWLEFKAGQLDFTTVPQAAYEEAFDVRTGQLARDWRLRGVDYQPIPLGDFIYRGFNLDDPVVGGMSPERIAFRRAIALTMPLEEINESRYNGLPVIYDGFLPPGLDGHLPAGTLDPPHRGPDLEGARQMLAAAGFTMVDGRATDTPTIDFWTNRGADNQAIFEMWERSFTQVGLRINPRYVDFSTLTDALDDSKAQMFGLAWGVYYPDPEALLRIFYGPNKAPGFNAFNFQDDEYDELYQRITVMPPGPERTAVYRRMQEIVNDACVFIGSQARVRQYLAHPWLRNFKAIEGFYTTYKYMDVDMDHPDHPSQRN